MSYKILILILFSVVFFACKKEETPPVKYNCKVNGMPDYTKQGISEAEKDEVLKNCALCTCEVAQ